MSATAVTPRHTRLSHHAAAIGLGCALALMALAMIVPWALDWNVNVLSFPPLHSEWMPRVGQGTIPAIAIGIVGLVYADRAARQRSWAGLVVTVYVVSVAWMVSLATVDGWSGIGTILNDSYEYLRTARATTDISATLHEYVSRIPFSSPDNWPVHIAGHPPGALLFFVLLVKLGLGSGLAAGWVVILLSATTPVAVLTTVRRLGAEELARRAAPLLVLGPAAIWMAVSADAVFGTAAAWGLCCLAFAATSTAVRARIAWSIGAGLVLGYAVMMSYGMPLLGVLAITVLVLARDWRPLPWAAAAALAVVVAFALAGFNLWDGYSALHGRYWDGVASRRPNGYWLWGDLAALCFSAGPMLGAGLAVVATKVRRFRELAADGRVIVALSAAAAVTIVIADLSLMSKAEVERIWLPFVPWLLLSCALLPQRWRKPALAIQIVTALAIQHLLSTTW